MLKLESITVNWHERAYFFIEYDHQSNEDADVCDHGEGGKLIEVPDPGEKHHWNEEYAYPSTLTNVYIVSYTKYLQTA